MDHHADWCYCILVAHGLNWDPEKLLNDKCHSKTFRNECYRGKKLNKRIGNQRELSNQCGIYMQISNNREKIMRTTVLSFRPSALQVCLSLGSCTKSEADLSSISHAKDWIGPLKINVSVILTGSY